MSPLPPPPPPQSQDPGTVLTFIMSNIYENNYIKYCSEYLISNFLLALFCIINDQEQGVTFFIENDVSEFTPLSRHHS